MTTKPAVLVTRAVFPDVVERLRAHFEVEDNRSDAILDKPSLIARMRDKDGASSPPANRSTPRCSMPHRNCARCARWRSASTTSTSRPAPRAACW